jgi:hypothetical protein
VGFISSGLVFSLIEFCRDCLWSFLKIVSCLGLQLSDALENWLSPP